jgi:Zn-dependent protease with chaperone function
LNKKRINQFTNIKANAMEQNQINYQIHSKENFYFTFKLIISILIYPLLFWGLYEIFTTELTPQATVFIFYAVAILFFLLVRLGLLIGHLKGNAIKIGEYQLPDIYHIAKKQSLQLGLSSTPDIYLMQAGGALNAFATRFMGTNYVVIYSDILEEAYESNKEAVEFIIGHELGHLKRKHSIKNLLLFPSAVVPFLSAAYSRACEYTCDNIGAALSPKGARNGLLILASGKKLYKKINLEKFSAQAESESGFWASFAEKVSSHPKLAKRISPFSNQEYTSIPVKEQPIVVETTDHSAYLPKF